MKTEFPIPRTSQIQSPEEENLSKLLQSRVRSFERFEGQENNDKAKPEDNNKKNFIEEFLEPYLSNFRTLKQKWQGEEFVKNTEIVADYLGGKIDSMMEKYLPSSSQEKANVQKAEGNLGVENPNKIKLKSGENLINQLKNNGVDLNEVNNKINMLDRIINPFSQYNESIPIKLQNGKEFRIDVKQYAEDLVAYNQLQKNTDADANAKDSSQSQQIELSGILELYGKQKFNEKFPQEGVKIPLSEEEKKSIETIQANANASDKERGKFAKKFGFEIEGNKPESIKVSLGSESLFRESSPEPIKGILKQQKVESSSEPKPEKTVRFGDENNKEYSPSEPPENVAKSGSWLERIKSEKASQNQGPARCK